MFQFDGDLSRIKRSRFSGGILDKQSEVDPTLELARAAIIAAGGKVKGEQSVSEMKEDA